MRHSRFHGPVKLASKTREKRRAMMRKHVLIVRESCDIIKPYYKVVILLKTLFKNLLQRQHLVR